MKIKTVIEFELGPIKELKVMTLPSVLPMSIKDFLFQNSKGGLGSFTQIETNC
jgi:hypothetical protein